jgi:hypothetical protein
MPSRSRRAAEADTVFDRRRSAADEAAARRVAQGQSRRATDGTKGELVARVAAESDEPRASRKRRATSDGREPLVIYMPPETIKRLKIAALEHDTTASAIATEAVVAWLRDAGHTVRGR